MELIHEFDVMNDICKREHQKMITECDADQFYYLRMHVFFFYVFLMFFIFFKWKRLNKLMIIQQHS